MRPKVAQQAVTLPCGHVTLSSIVSDGTSETAYCRICSNDSFHMSPADFLEHGSAAIRWVANYHDKVESLPVVAQVSPGDLRAQLPDQAPRTGERFETILEDLDRHIVPATTHWQSPNFHAYFPSNVSGPSIIAELISAGMSVQGMLWKTSPACTELESHVLDWLVHAMDLPKTFLSTSPGGGVIQDTASSAALCALLAARERATSGQSNLEGMRQPLVAYASSETHSSIEKAVRIAGVGSNNLRIVQVDTSFAMSPDHLDELIRKDRADGFLPFFACATIGTTSSNAMDPIRTIGEICDRNDIWFHVDAAMSGTAALCPEFRYLFDGLELSDSFNFNPHKWMMTNFDCSCLFVKSRVDLINALSINPEYLHTDEYASGKVIDYRDWQVPLGRRFRALKLWFVLRYYGIEGLQHHIRYHVDLTRTVEDWVSKDSDFEIIVPSILNMFCFRLRAGKDQTESLLNLVNDSGRAYMTHTVIGNTYVIRWCIGNVKTTIDHVSETWAIIQALKEQIAK